MKKSDLKKLVNTGSFGELGVTLMSVRKERKLTQKELAELSEIDQGAISRMESGKMNTTLGKLQAILNALHAELELIIILKDPPAKTH